MDMKKEVGKVVLGILYLIVFISVVRFFNLNKWGVIGLILVTSILFSIKKFNIKKWFINAIFITIFINLLFWLDQFGAIGWTIGILLIPTVIIARRWKKYLEVKEHIEERIWGEPLKNFRKRGERPPKIKVGI